jgi:hypothetical protein
MKTRIATAALVVWCFCSIVSMKPGPNGKLISGAGGALPQPITVNQSAIQGGGAPRPCLPKPSGGMAQTVSITGCPTQ